MKANLFFFLIVTMIGADALRHRKLVRAEDGKRIDEDYILIFREGTNTKIKVAELSAALPDCTVRFTYEDDKVQGAAVGKITAEQLSSVLEDPDILFVEEVRICHQEIRTRLPFTVRLVTLLTFTFLQIIGPDD